jgi:hypothetical protein
VEAIRADRPDALENTPQSGVCWEWKPGRRERMTRSRLPT